ncbi:MULTISPECIES: VOC family protein [Pseudomonas]|jgi:catechol 2,3-dioxygenase-like lactoylglutathione lyase family enzyme|uniref:VOC family protein n=2 Tax=Pseudomonas TaxID=286 RepID=UPI0028775CA2|nr:MULTISPECIES: VOC family protein [Pseudomonas]
MRARLGPFTGSRFGPDSCVFIAAVVATMISHVCLGVGDFDRAFAFYSKIMADLDLTLKFCEASKPWAGWVSKTSSRPLFVIGKPFDGNACEPGNGNMVALLAPNREAVRRSHATALALGGTCEGAPGLRPHYHPDYYGAYFRDPDGNKLCVCCHSPA